MQNFISLKALKYFALVQFYKIGFLIKLFKFYFKEDTFEMLFQIQKNKIKLFNKNEKRFNTVTNLPLFEVI